MSPDLGLKLGPLDPELRSLSPMQKESKNKQQKEENEAANLLFYL